VKVEGLLFMDHPVHESIINQLFNWPNVVQMTYSTLMR